MNKIFGFGLGIVVLLSLLTVQAKLAGVQAATNPATYFLQGTVWYRVNGNLIPATYGGVRIIASSGKNEYIQSVDGNGKYSLIVPAGSYKVSATNLLKARFDPARYMLKIVSNTTGINFTGI